MRFKKNKTQTLNNNHKPQAVKNLKNTKKQEAKHQN